MSSAVMAEPGLPTLAEVRATRNADRLHRIRRHLAAQPRWATHVEINDILTLISDVEPETIDPQIARDIRVQQAARRAGRG